MHIPLNILGGNHIVLNHPKIFFLVSIIAYIELNIMKKKRNRIKCPSSESWSLSKLVSESKADSTQI